MPSSLNDWQRLKEELKVGLNLSQPERLAALEEFRQRLVRVCGEEPSIVMTLGHPVYCLEDLVDVPLSDYLGWLLKASHGAVYRWQEGSFQCLASFGFPPRQVNEQALLPQWLLEHGLLVRSKLTLEGLTAEEAELLLQELDTLDAHLVVPITFNEDLWGFFTVGPPLAGGGYDGSEGIYLNLYGLSVMNCLERRRQNLPTRKEMRFREEDKALREVMELWAALKPRQTKVKLLIVDEEPEAVDVLTRFFTDWGFDVKGATTEEVAIEDLEQRLPQLLLIDLGLNWRFPKDLVEIARALVPEGILLGTTAVRNEAWDELVLGLGVQQIFRKPCRFARLVMGVFEAALNISVRAEPTFGTKAERCLIVDDEQEAAQALQGYFEARGFRVWTTSSLGKEALKLISKVRPHLVLLDLKIPASIGSDLLRRIRKNSPKTKVIVLTAWIHEHPEKALKALRPDAYGLKPVPVEELDRLVEEVLC